MVIRSKQQAVEETSKNCVVQQADDAIVEKGKTVPENIAQSIDNSVLMESSSDFEARKTEIEPHKEPQDALSQSSNKSETCSSDMKNKSMVEQRNDVVDTEDKSEGTSSVCDNKDSIPVDVEKCHQSMDGSKGLSQTEACLSDFAKSIVDQVVKSAIATMVNSSLSDSRVRREAQAAREDHEETVKNSSDFCASDSGSPGRKAGGPEYMYEFTEKTLSDGKVRGVFRCMDL